ncbi:MAG: RNA polymerase sigma factor [Nocardioidaceae bacterium]
MGEAEYVREVYDASYGRLVRQLLGLTGSLSEAEDVVQEAFVRALDHASRFRRVDNPEAWLRTVAVNLYRSRWRRLRRFARLAPQLADGAPATSQDGADRIALLAALRVLPAAQREVIALHHLADLPVHEVAATLGVPAGTVKARLSRGRTALAVLLTDQAELPDRPSQGVSHG